MLICSCSKSKHEIGKKHPEDHETEELKARREGGEAAEKKGNTGHGVY